MARPKKSEGRDTSREILDASLELFSQHGFAGTSMREIARAVGVRESALYHHFPSKDAIFKALTLELGPGKVRLLEHLDYDAALADGGLLLLKQMVRLISAEWSDPREQRFARLLLSEGPRLSQTGTFRVDLFFQSAVDAFTRLFSELIARKLVRSEPPDLLAGEFLGPLMFLRVRWLVMAPEPDLKQFRALAERHVEYFWRTVST